MDYISQQSPLIMPEYGRNVQRMVEYALTIEDKRRRTECVRSIMQTMSNLFPYLKSEDSRHKMYDHLAIMSNFKLDIDFPYNRPTPDGLRYKHTRLPYNTDSPIRFRHYGKMVEIMINNAILEQNVAVKRAMIIRIATLMKRNFIAWNKDQNVDDERIKNDISLLSNGQLNCDFEGFQIVVSHRQGQEAKQGNQKQNSKVQSKSKHRNRNKKNKNAR